MFENWSIRSGTQGGRHSRIPNQDEADTDHVHHNHASDHPHPSNVQSDVDLELTPASETHMNRQTSTGTATSSSSSSSTRYSSGSTRSILSSILRPTPRNTPGMNMNMGMNRTPSGQPGLVSSDEDTDDETRSLQRQARPQQQPQQVNDVMVEDFDDEEGQVQGQSQGRTQAQGQDHDHNAQMLSQHETAARVSALLLRREIHRRGSFGCTMILTIIVFRLWLEALMTLDFSLFLMSFFLTSYVIAWRRRRDTMEWEMTQEIERIQSRVTNGDENGDDDNDNLEEGNGNDDNDDSREARRNRRARMNRQRRRDQLRATLDTYDFSGNNDHIDLEMLSFQAQLAFAIMESQRHIMETGGYGRPDGDDDNQNQTRGVSDETKEKWDMFKYDLKDPKVLECEDLKPAPSKTAAGHKNEDPSCCICLCEYEQGEELAKLSCGHVYHKDCIESWCENHVRCPLCNLNLEGEDDGSHDEIV